MFYCHMIDQKRIQATLHTFPTISVEQCTNVGSNLHARIFHHSYGFSDVIINERFFKISKASEKNTSLKDVVLHRYLHI